MKLLTTNTKALVNLSQQVTKVRLEHAHVTIDKSMGLPLPEKFNPKYPRKFLERLAGIR